MRVMKFKADTRKVRMLTISERFIIETDLLNYDMLKKEDIWAKNWAELPFYIYNPQNVEHDFWSNSEFLNFNKKALDTCFTPFEMCGEILPVKVEEHEDLYFFNCLKVCNALDKEKSQINVSDRKTKKYLHRPVLIKERIDFDAPIFFVPNVHGYLFCIVDQFDRDEDFYHLYKDNDLTGLIFEEIELI